MACQQATDSARILPHMPDTGQAASPSLLIVVELFSIYVEIKAKSSRSFRNHDGIKQDFWNQELNRSFSESRWNQAEVFKIKAKLSRSFRNKSKSSWSFPNQCGIKSEFWNRGGIEAELSESRRNQAEVGIEAEFSESRRDQAGVFGIKAESSRTFGIKSESSRSFRIQGGIKQEFSESRQSQACSAFGALRLSAFGTFRFLPKRMRTAASDRAMARMEREHFKRHKCEAQERKRACGTPGRGQGGKGREREERGKNGGAGVSVPDSA